MRTVVYSKQAAKDNKRMKRNMKLKNLKIIFWGLCIAFCACKNNKFEKATDTRLAETKKC